MPELILPLSAGDVSGSLPHALGLQLLFVCRGRINQWSSFAELLK